MALTSSFFIKDKTTFAAEKLVPVVVQTKEGYKAKHGLRVKQLGGHIKRNLALIKGFSAELPLPAIEKLSADSDIIYISRDAEVKACLDTALAAANVPTAWTSGFTGEGITVAVVDTGIYPHADLTLPANRIIAFADFVNDFVFPYDDNGHGTHVAGIIAGNGNSSSGVYRGVAPKARLVGVKVLGSNGSGFSSDVIAGIQWVVQNKERLGIKILNLSLGAKTTDPYDKDPLSKATEAAWQAGIVVVAAAGNNGPELGTIASPGISPSIITVGAADDKGTVNSVDDIIAAFSSRGSNNDNYIKPDLVASGVNITSLAADVSYLPKRSSPAKIKASGAKGNSTPSFKPYTTMSGTSMATPMGAGIAALMLERAPGLSPVELKNMLINKAVNMGFLMYEQGAGEIRFE